MSISRYFTVEEANALLPHIASMMGRILLIRQRILERHDTLVPVLEKGGWNSGSRVASEVADLFRQLEEAVEAIHRTGAQVKDVNMGLVDFPALRRGEEVFLCWQYGEPHIAYWHGLHAGYAGRRPIDEF